jgi:hypothetical protein
VGNLRADAVLLRSFDYRETPAEEIFLTDFPKNWIHKRSIFLARLARNI